mgnify:CR=1 FL=1
MASSGSQKKSFLYQKEMQYMYNIFLSALYQTIDDMNYKWVKRLSTMVQSKCVTYLCILGIHDFIVGAK